MKNAVALTSAELLEIVDPHDATCPCCGDSMGADMLVCWTCWRLSRKLMPGVHSDGNGGVFWITQADIDRYTSERYARADVAPGPQPVGSLKRYADLLSEVRS